MNVPAKALSLSVLAALAVMACGKEAPPPPAPAASAPPAAQPPLVVKIGHSAPLTGPQAHIGKDNENGARLALEDANAAKIKIDGRDVTFELVPEDDQADPKQGNLVAQKFVDAKVNAVVGHLNSGTTIPASKLYADAGIPQVSPSATNPQYTNQGFKTAFRVMANDEQQGKVLGEYAVNNLKAKTVAVIDDKTAYGEGVAHEFLKSAVAAGAKVVAEEHTDDKAVDFKAILTKIKGKKPDLIFYGGMDPQAAPMAKQMKQLGIKAKYLLADGGCTAEFIKNAGDAAEGHYCSLPGIPYEKMPGGPKFIERYKAKFNADIQLYGPYAYDAAMVVIEAVKRAQSADPAKILAELPKTDFQGVTTRILFDEKGDLKDGAITLYVAKGGKWEPLDTIGGATAPAAEAKPAEAMGGMTGMQGMAGMAGINGMTGMTGIAAEATKLAPEKK
ncbi:MAG: branched-chain amino acid ABC transporter substrate-binding protein [Sterolibacteriaceae bacterium MAG5]|nr:branched-chain amino acid ABC transporter substrate-binding protein [Candidatus Nitricoxidireducens bremensis]